MTFQIGQSGNPAGRPKGSVNRQLKMLREAAEQVLPLVLERALAGDFDAQKLLIERGMPRMKSIAPAEEFAVPDAPLSYQLEALIKQVTAGELSTTAASQAVQMLLEADKAKVIEVNTAEAKATRQAIAQASEPQGMYFRMLNARVQNGN
ncbi:MAG: DUF5681 domain-containing protein [Parabacteroides sp.]|nr:DUF5681 domain-containing protein [Parabacteroides sp.]